ncbi:MAG TPA: hypothetical protein VMT34_05315 [Aggregatilineales bacterium]|nr:hypothetical protein [Aggregatilineales bacterium]
MLKVKVIVPATIINLGPGLDTLGIAVTLHNTVEMSLRPPSPPAESAPVQGEKSAEAATKVPEAGLSTAAPASLLAPEAPAPFTLNVSGENHFPVSDDHPVIRAAKTLFDEAKTPFPSASITCTGEIPTELGDRTAWTVGGLMAANNLLSTPLKREQIVALACRLSEPPAAVVASLMGSLSVTSGWWQDLIYRRIDIPILRVILVAPKIPGYREQVDVLPRTIDLRDTAFNMGRIALLVEALRTGDNAFLTRLMEIRGLDSARKALIPDYDSVLAAARNAGAITAALSGNGPYVIAFAPPLVVGGRVKAPNTQAIETAMVDAFRAAGVESRAWTLNVDTQGIVLTVQQ